MLDALLDEEFATKKRREKEDLDALLDAHEQENPGMTWGDVLSGAKAVGNFAKTAVLPTAGNIAGAAAGALTGPAAPAMVPILEAGGGVLGEWLNQKLGITPPSAEALGVQALLPPVIRGVSAANKIIPPSTSGAEFLNTIAPREAAHVLGTLGITKGAGSAKMAAATAETTHIPAGTTGDVIRNELDNLGGSTGSGMYEKTAQHLRDLGKLLYNTGHVLSPERYQKELRDLRARINLLGEGRPNEVEKAALSKVKAHMEEALLHNPTGERLAGARLDILRESVLDDLETMTYNASKNQAHQGTQTQWNGRAILDKIEGKGGKENEAFKRRFEAAFEPGDRNLIHRLYQKLNSFDKLSPGANVNAGSMRILAPVGAGLTLGAGAHAMGASPGLASGVAAAAMAVPPVMHASRVLGLALSTREGRKELGRILSDPHIKSWGDMLPRLIQFMSASEPVQTAIRPTPTMIQPFDNER